MIDGKNLYEKDPDEWWHRFFVEAGARLMNCHECPFECNECAERGCGNVIANRFLTEHSEGNYEW